MHRIHAPQQHRRVWQFCKIKYPEKLLEIKHIFRPSTKWLTARSRSTACRWQMLLVYVSVCVLQRLMLLIPCFPSKKGPMSSCSGKLIKVLSFFLWPVCLEKKLKGLVHKWSYFVIKNTFKKMYTFFYQSVMQYVKRMTSPHTKQCKAMPYLSKTKRMSCRLRVGGRLCSLILRVALCLL